MKVKKPRKITAKQLKQPKGGKLSLGLKTKTGVRAGKVEGGDIEGRNNG